MNISPINLGDRLTLNHKADDRIAVVDSISDFIVKFSSRVLFVIIIFLQLNFALLHK